VSALSRIALFLNLLNHPQADMATTKRGALWQKFPAHTDRSDKPPPSISGYPSPIPRNSETLKLQKSAARGRLASPF
jgi:hypothetical protein